MDENRNIEPVEIVEVADAELDDVSGGLFKNGDDYGSSAISRNGEIGRP
jgi:hypothetical protein